MAKKKVREYDAKRLVRKAVESSGVKISFNGLKVVLIDKDTNWEALRKDPTNQWLFEVKLVAKPDMMFGQRGKHNLVLLNANIDEIQKFVTEWLESDKVLDIKGVKGRITHFIVEPFVPHDVEYYLSIAARREDTIVNFSSVGGVEIEEHWNEKVKTVEVPVGKSIESVVDDSYFAGVRDDHLQLVKDYVFVMFRLFEDLDMLTLETNPFTIITDENGTKQPFPLDMVMEMDDTARFKNYRKWDNLVFPDVFGHNATSEERFIENLDGKTGASLKLTVLNNNGRIWNLVAGGGASVIFADTVADLGHGELLGNYGEYSGAPNAEETYHYARTILGLCTQACGDQKARVLIIGGGIANFTDIAKTFKGIVHALNEYAEQLKLTNTRIYVRRAGPNYQQGIKLVKNRCKELGLYCEAYGPEKNMTDIIPMAIDYLKSEGIVA